MRPPPERSVRIEGAVQHRCTDTVRRLSGSEESPEVPEQRRGGPVSTLVRPKTFMRSESEATPS